MPDMQEVEPSASHGDAPFGEVLLVHGRNSKGKGSSETAYLRFSLGFDEIGREMSVKLEQLDGYGPRIGSYCYEFAIRVVIGHLLQ